MNATSRQETNSELPVLFEEIPARLTRKGAIAELGQRALLSQDVDGFLVLAVDLVRDVLDVDYSKVLQQSAVGGPLLLTAGSGWQEQIRVGETTLPADNDSQALHTLASGEPVFVEDLEHETRFRGDQILLDHHVVSGMSVVIQGPETPYGVLGVFTTRPRRFTMGDSDFLRAVATIIGNAVENQRAVQNAVKSARFETALADCAQALLVSSGASRLHEALVALFIATEATYVFVERNVVDPELGFCTQVVAEAEDEDEDASDWEMDNEYWDLVPWDRMPTTRKSLEAGLPIVIIPEELEGPEYEQYAEDPFPVKSELELPIFVGGMWAGLIGFSDQNAVRDWSVVDVSLLSTAAKMIGAFWEREASQERLEKSNRAKDELIASVSHELRTPLTAVVGFGRLLHESADTIPADERAELLELLVSQGTDLSNIVSDLLVAARTSTGSVEVASVPVNLHAQVNQVLESFQHGKAAEIELAGELVRAVGDPDRIRQIVRNLVSNALRYGGDTIRIELIADAGRARVLVCDDGTPIPEEDRERIFQPYRRAHAAPGLVDSLGLGLTISRQLAQLMHGDLTYRHEDGESIFELVLPIDG